MQGHKHNDDRHINMTNLKDFIQSRFQYANHLRRCAKEAKKDKAKYSEIYRAFLSTVNRTEDVVRALYKPRHYRALEDAACKRRIELLSQEKSSELTEKSSKEKLAS